MAYEYLKQPILEYLQKCPRNDADSISICSYFGLSIDITLTALRELENEGRVVRRNFGTLEGAGGNYYCEAVKE